jgi:phosphoribosylpyrophosphate synthetase
MGRATNLADALKTRPLSVAELDERRQAAKVRENVTTTLDGDVVERVTPKAAPAPVAPREPVTWD